MKNNTNNPEWKNYLSYVNNNKSAVSFETFLRRKRPMRAVSALIVFDDEE